MTNFVQRIFGRHATPQTEQGVAVAGEVIDKNYSTKLPADCRADQAPIGALGISNALHVGAPTVRNGTYGPTRSSGDTEYRSALGDAYHEQAMAGTAAITLPPLNPDGLADRSLVAWTQQVLELLADWQLQEQRAWQAWQAAREAEALVPRPWHTTHRLWAAVGTALVGLALSFVFVPLLGEAFDLLLLRTWTHAIEGLLEDYSDTDTAQMWLDHLRLATPMVSAVCAFLFAAAVNCGQAFLTVWSRGNIPWYVKALFLLVDIALGGAVYVLRVASSLAVLALPAAAIEVVLALLNTSINLGVGKTLKEQEALRRVQAEATQLVSARHEWLQTTLDQVAIATTQARAAVAAVGMREHAGHWQQVDAQLAQVEARIGYLEALRDNHADMLRAAMPTDPRARAAERPN